MWLEVHDVLIAISIKCCDLYMHAFIAGDHEDMHTGHNLCKQARPSLILPPGLPEWVNLHYTVTHTLLTNTDCDKNNT